MELNVTNVNQALAAGLQWLKVAGVEEPSRNGPVIVSNEPVMTVYSKPRERVLFSPLRDANPAFHLMEALWLLAGRVDLEFPVYFNKNFAQYSDDGVIHPGAYGYRWRKYFDYDQLPLIVKELKQNSNTRRAVLTMWDGGYNAGIFKEEGEVKREGDLSRVLRGTKDAPCNTHAYVDCRNGVLNITVLCRSNDIYWGAYGANAVQMSILQEYLAAAVGVPVGVYRQFSNNFHIYTNVVPRERFSELATDAKAHDIYQLGEVTSFPLVSVPVEEWNKDLDIFMANPAGYAPYADKFFSHVARPMYLSWKERKEKRGTGLDYAAKILAPDWRRACTEWIERREAKKAKAKETAHWRDKNGF